MDLADLRGQEMVVLFWNPDCGFCQQMLPELKAWEANPPPEAPQLVVVSTGTVETNRALRLRAPVLLDQNFSARSAFGANGTPMVVLVDADGRIAAPPAAGAAQVLALATGRWLGRQTSRVAAGSYGPVPWRGHGPRRCSSCAAA